MSTTTDLNERAAGSDALLDKPSYKHYVLGILVVGYVFNSIDRGVFGILVQPLKETLHVSDTAMGLLTGLAFSVFYSVMGVPIARLADRWSRINVLSLAVALWSTATALCGAAFNYASLFVLRSSTAVGEAGGTPPSHSLISDYFALSSRATALAVYAMAVPLGAALGNFVSGWSNVFFGWRATFALVGLPGLLVALLIRLTVKEPPRGYADGPEARDKHKEAPPFAEVFRFLLTRRSFLHMSVAAALHSVVYYSGTSWNATFFIRSHGMNTGVAGTYLSVFALIAAIGSFAGGYLADRISTRKGDARWYMWVPAIACMVMVPFDLVAYLAPNLAVVVPAFSVMLVLAAVFFGPSFAVAQSVATVRMRAVSTSVLLFIQTIIGLTLGPFIVGEISDHLMPAVGASSLRYGLAVIGLVNLWAAYHYLCGARSYREELAETARLNAAA